MKIVRHYFFSPKSKWWCKKILKNLKNFNTTIFQLNFLPTLSRTSNTLPAAEGGGSRAETPYVSLAYRLNPNRRGYDAEFKAKWAEMPKLEQQITVRQDKEVRMCTHTPYINVVCQYTFWRAYCIRGRK